MRAAAILWREVKSVFPGRCFLPDMAYSRTVSSGRAAVCLSFLWLAATAASGYDWLQMNGDSRHSGNNTLEAMIAPDNVANLGFLFQVPLPSIADGAPVLLTGVNTPQGTRDVLYLTTKAGHIVALNAHTGASIWSQQVGPGSCKTNNSGGSCYTTSSPAIDPNRLYVYSYGLDGFVHKYQVGDGTEIKTGGWPELTTNKGFNEKGSSALSFAASGGATYLYVTHGGYPGDRGDYQGHVTAINLGTGAQNVFNANCSDQTAHFEQTPATPDCSHVQSAIWARVGVVYDSVTDQIFMGTGNGDYDANVGQNDWGDSIIALKPDGTGSLGRPLDSYTPTTFAALQGSDKDLGSTAPAILPAPGYSGRLAVQGGKDGKLRLINLANLSGMAGPGNVGGEIQSLNVPQGCVVLSAPAVWVNPGDSSTWVFVTNGCGASGLKLTVTGGVPSLVMQWQNTDMGASPLIANNVLYFADSNVIRAVDPVTGNTLWSNTTKLGSIHWQSPVVANGVLYISDQSARVTAFTLPFPFVSISPSWGPTTGGTQATLYGSGFPPGATVTFGGAAATGTPVVNPTTIVATTPSHAAGAVNVVITNPGGPSATLTNGFTYSNGARLFTLLPCRAVDTRNAAGALGGPALSAGADRIFTLTGACAIPSTAKALSVNVTVTQSTASGSITLFQGSTALPPIDTLDYGTAQTRANNAVIALGSAGDVIVHCGQATGTVHFILDVNGYLQ